MPAWRFYYIGGKVYDSARHSPADLPDDGVLIGMVYFEDGTRQIAMGDTWYWLADGEIQHNSDPLEDNKRRYPGVRFLRGQWTSRAELEYVREAAMASEAP